MTLTLVEGLDVAESTEPSLWTWIRAAPQSSNPHTST